MLQIGMRGCRGGKQTEGLYLHPVTERMHMSHQTGKATGATANPCVTHGGLGPNRRGERITEIYLQGWVEGLEWEAESSDSKETQLPGPYLPGPAGRQDWRAHPNAAGSGRRPPACSSPGKAPLPSAMAPSASKDLMPLDLGAGRAGSAPSYLTHQGYPRDVTERGRPRESST